MQKVTILIMIGITSLAIMACGFSGFIQQSVEEQPAHTESPSQIQEMAESAADDEIETTIQTEISPAPTVDPILEAQSCLANTWEINGLSDYVIAAVPPDLAEEYDLQYEDTTGAAYFILSPDGKIIIAGEASGQIHFLRLEGA